MPQWYYVLLHPEAKLSDAERASLVAGLRAMFGGSDLGEEDQHQNERAPFRRKCLEHFLHIDQLSTFEVQAFEKRPRIVVVALEERLHATNADLLAIFVTGLDQAPADTALLVVGVDADRLNPATFRQAELVTFDVSKQEADKLTVVLGDEGEQGLARQI